MLEYESLIAKIISYSQVDFSMQRTPSSAIEAAKKKPAVLKTAATAAATLDPFPTFSCTVTTSEKSHEKATEVRRCCAIIEENLIKFSNSMSDKAPLKSFRLDQISFHMHSDGEKQNSSDEFTANYDYSQFEMKVTERKRIPGSHGYEDDQVSLNCCITVLLISF